MLTGDHAHRDNNDGHGDLLLIPFCHHGYTGLGSGVCRDVLHCDPHGLARTVLPWFAYRLLSDPHGAPDLWVLVLDPDGNGVPLDKVTVGNVGPCQYAHTRDRLDGSSADGSYRIESSVERQDRSLRFLSNTGLLLDLRHGTPVRPLSLHAALTHSPSGRSSAAFSFQKNHIKKTGPMRARRMGLMWVERATLFNYFARSACLIPNGAGDHRWRFRTYH